MHAFTYVRTLYGREALCGCLKFKFRTHFRSIDARYKRFASCQAPTIMQLIAARRLISSQPVYRPLIRMDALPNDAPLPAVPGDISLHELRSRMRHFAEERDWQQYHTPRNLLMALVGEVRPGNGNAPLAPAICLLAQLQPLYALRLCTLSSVGFIVSV